MSRFKNLGDLADPSLDPDKVAVIDLSGQAAREFTYRDLDEAAQGVARGLLRRGFSRGDRVAILSANRFEYFAAFNGAMRAGLVAVPVNHRFPASTIQFVVRDSGAKILFCDAERFAAAPSGLPVVGFEGDGEPFDAFVDPGPFASIVPEPGEPAMFLYTSGSTGTPKGVVLSHQSHLWVVETRLGRQDLSHHRFLIAAPLYHMNALALSQLATAAHATIVLLPQFNAEAYIRAIERYRATWLTAVPPMIAMMLREEALLAATELSSVKQLRMGSAPVSQSLMQAIRRAIPHAAVTNAYGTTEGGPVVFGPHPAGLPTPDLSVGYPHPQVATRLIDEQGREAGQGVLEMRSPALMNGYHNRPDIEPPLTPDGFYVTGDVFRRDENGFHFFVGRTDDMFVSGGENIYPGDVEKMLERHPDIVQACVVPVEDDIKGTKPVAFVVPRTPAALTEADVKSYALTHAPAYQHPRSVWFVDSLPLASTNKLDRNALKALAAERLRAAPA